MTTQAQRPLTKEEINLKLRDMKVTVGHAWQSRFHVGKPMHVVARIEGTDKYVMYCTGSRATKAYGHAFAGAAVTCTRCLNILRDEIQKEH